MGVKRAIRSHFPSRATTLFDVTPLVVAKTERTLLYPEYIIGCLPGEPAPGSRWLVILVFSYFCSIPSGVRCHGSSEAGPSLALDEQTT